MTRTKSTYLALVAVLLSPMAVNADPIQGAIGFGGLFVPTGGAGLDLSDATGIAIGFSQVVSATGDFIPAVGSSAAFNQLDFNPANTPVAPFWTVNVGPITYSFILQSIMVDLQTSSTLNLSGIGLVSATGFDNTPLAWTWSGQQGNVFFTFSGIGAATDPPTPVPEPGTLALLALGLVGMGLSRRKKKV